MFQRTFSAFRIRPLVVGDEEHEASSGQSAGGALRRFGQSVQRPLWRKVFIGSMALGQATRRLCVYWSSALASDTEAS